MLDHIGVYLMLNGEGDCLALVLQMVIVGHHYLNALMPVTSIPVISRWMSCSFISDPHFPGSSYMAHDRIFAGDTHAAQHLAGVAANIGGDLAGIAFGHAYLLWRNPSFVHQYTQSPVQQLRFGDLRDHLRQLLC